MAATLLDFQDEGQDGFEGLGQVSCFPELTEDSLYPLESWRTADHLAVVPEDQEDEGRFDHWFALHSLLERSWEEKYLLAGPQKKTHTTDTKPARSAPSKERRDADSNKPTLKLVTDLAASTPAPLSTPITEDLNTFDTLFADTLQHTLDTDAPTTPATTPGSTQSLSLSLTEGSKNATLPTDEDSTPLPTILEEEPVPNPQAEDATVQPTPQQSESGVPVAATPTETAEVEASSTSIDKDDAADRQGATTPPGDTTTINPPSDKGVDTTTTQATITSTKGTLEKGLNTKRARAEADDNDNEEADELAATISKRARTTVPAGDVGNAGSSSFQGGMPTHLTLPVIDWRTMETHKELEHAPGTPKGVFCLEGSPNDAGAANLGSLRTHAPASTPQQPLVKNPYAGWLAMSWRPTLPLPCPAPYYMNMPTPLPAPVATRPPLPPPPTAAAAAAAAQALDDNHGTVPTADAPTSREKGKAKGTTSSRARKTVAKPAGASTSSSTPREKGKAKTTTSTRARKVETKPAATASSSSSGAVRTRTPAAPVNDIQTPAWAASCSYETEGIWDIKQTQVYLPPSRPRTPEPEGTGIVIREWLSPGQVILYGTEADKLRAPEPVNFD